jgi:hypothetical protein
VIIDGNMEWKEVVNALNEVGFGNLNVSDADMLLLSGTIPSCDQICLLPFSSSHLCFVGVSCEKVLREVIWKTVSSFNARSNVIAELSAASERAKADVEALSRALEDVKQQEEQMKVEYFEMQEKVELSQDVSKLNEISDQEEVKRLQHSNNLMRAQLREAFEQLRQNELEFQNCKEQLNSALSENEMRKTREKKAYAQYRGGSMSPEARAHMQRASEELQNELSICKNHNRDLALRVAELENIQNAPNSPASVGRRESVSPKHSEKERDTDDKDKDKVATVQLKEVKKLLGIPTASESESIVPYIERVVQVLSAVPRMEEFIRSVCEMTLGEGIVDQPDSSFTPDQALPAIMHLKREAADRKALASTLEAVAQELHGSPDFTQAQLFKDIRYLKAARNIAVAKQKTTSAGTSADMEPAAAAALVTQAEETASAHQRAAQDTIAVDHFCDLFDVKARTGVMPQMVVLRRYVSETSVALTHLRQVLDIPVNASLPECVRRADQLARKANLKKE